MRGRLFVGRVSPDGPAARAGLTSGDILLAVGNEEVSTLADFYRKLWGRGPAGAEVPLKVLKGARVAEVNVRSIDRVEYFQAVEDLLAEAAGGLPRRSYRDRIGAIGMMSLTA